ncbi:hypothetical protein FGG08_001459 [Glutinoglossum americanum]|uniref:Pre-rRNA-processing protein RIX1 n=1 Tax=Glutinoglossum americanum TaxID=1670608 RepID=A0A9P8IET8_9PEZI|nr:hypothetical protein FGG08_001459 [Glutinoglossum americanum]
MQPYQTLKREIITPTLPNFISACLNLVKSRQSSDPREFNISSTLLPSILDAFCILLPHHPTLFRPHLSRIVSLICPLLAPTPTIVFSDGEQNTEARFLGTVSTQCSTAAQHLHVLLPYCAPQNTVGEVWLKGFRTTIFEVHQTIDQVFRAVVEDWEPLAGQLPHGADVSAFGNTVGDGGGRTMGLPGWTGIQAGTGRLIGLLELLSKYIGSPTAAPISLPLGLMMDVLTRLFSLTVPPVRERDNPQESVRFNPQISKEEREGLWAGLPRVHVAGMKLLTTLVERLGEAFFPMVRGSLDQISWVFSAEGWDAEIRIAAYTILSKILVIAGISLPKSSVLSLSRMFQSCCCDLLPPQQQNPSTLNTPDLKMKNKKSDSSQQLPANADSFLAPWVLPLPSSQIFKLHPGLRQAAYSFLPLILLSIPSQHLRLSLRSQIDRTAILIQHKEAMMASVLSPPSTTETRKARSSILPHLVRSCPSDFEIEALFRPRMPVIPIGRGLLEDDGDDVMEDSHSHEEHARGNFIDDTTNTNPRHSSIMPSSEPYSKDQDVHLPRPMSPIQQPVDPLPPSGRSKRFCDRTDRSDEDQSSDSAPETQRRHGPPSPKRLRAGSAVDDSRLAARVSESAYSPAGQSPALATSFSHVVDPPGQPPASASDVHVPTGLAAVARASVDIESDSEFEVPELVMDADTDDGEDMEDEIGGGGPSVS